MKLRKGLIVASLAFITAGCSNVPPHTHTFSDVWDHNDTEHWHNATCDHDEKSDLAEHIYNQEVVSSNTLKTAATCEGNEVYYKSCVCGAVSATETFEKANSALGHNVSQDWSKDATHHWHTCANDASEKFDLGTHTFNQEVTSIDALKTAATCEDNAVYYKSCVCGLISTTETFEKANSALGHDASQNWTHDATNHWHTCGNNSSEKLDLASHVYDQETVSNAALKTAATCEQNAVYYKSCVCGAVSDTITFEQANSALGHNPSQDWSKDATHHWHTCSNDATEQLDKEEHVVNTWVTVTDSTINAEGVKKGNCIVCGQEITAPINKVLETVDQIKESIAKIGNLTSIKMLDGSLIEETKAAYNNLSAADKNLVDNYSVLEEAFTVWESNYTMVYDPLINGIPTIEGYPTSVGQDPTYGTILKINVPSTDETTQFAFNINSSKFGKDSILHIFIRSPFETIANTSQSVWFGEYEYDVEEKKHLVTLASNGWTEIASTGKELSASGANETEIIESISLQRYLHQINVEYSGEYYMASIIAEKVEEGSVIIPVSTDSIYKENTWKGDVSTISSFSDIEHGKGARLNISAITGAYEIKINGLNILKAKKFDFITCYVYAPAAAKFYFSQHTWRNEVMTVGVDPNDKSANANAADNQPQYDRGWHKVVIPTSYLPDASFIYFEIYTPSALGEWIITDFCAGNYSNVVSDAKTRWCGLSTLNSGNGKFEGTFTKGTDEDYGSYDEISITDLSACKWGPTIRVGGDTIESDQKYLRFYVYSPLEKPINMAIYGNGWYESIFADGHMFNTCLMPQQWNEIIITTNCYNKTDKAFRKFDFTNMTIFFEDIRQSTSNIILDGLKISSFEIFDSYPEDAEQDLNYDINENAMYILGTSNTGNQQMMGFVLTYNGKVIIVDGGMRDEYRQLKNILTSLGGHVDYQIFTHAHKDHFGTFIEMAKDSEITVDTLVYNFSSWDNIRSFTQLEADKLALDDFKVAVESFTGNVITCGKGTTIAFDDFVLEFLNNRYEITGDVNEASMCFKVTTANNSVMFLGDLSQNNAPKVLNEYKDNLSKLQANYLQLAHHGQRGGCKELYQAINPNYAIWCTTVRNYNNWTVNGFETGAIKSAETREWLSGLDVVDVCPFYRTIKVAL